MPAIQRVEFETPERIVVGYELAGLGTRFIAWLIDRVLLLLLFLVVALFVAFSGVGLAFLLDADGSFLSGYTVGLLFLIQGFGSFLYFGLSEYYMGGQTFGKRQFSIRVVSVKGFSLSPRTIVIRNLFRLIDQLPVFWLIPLVTRHAQRFGDLVAGTIVIADEKQTSLEARTPLPDDTDYDTLFRFEDRTLRRLPPGDVEAIEKILARWQSLDEPMRASILEQVCDPLAEKLGCAAPPPEKRFHFVRDILRAERRRQARSLR